MRKFQSPGSLELLLDAMCNVFGVVLLTAIFIGGAAAFKRLTAPDGTVERKVFEQLANEYVMLQQETENAILEINISSALANTTKSPAVLPDDEKSAEFCRRQAQKANELAGRIENAQKKVDQLRKDFAFQKKVSIKTLDSKIKALAEKIADPDNSAGVKELPVRIDAGKLQPWRVIVSAGKLYNAGSNAMIRRTGSASGDVKIKSFRLDGMDFYRLEKVPERGVVIEKFALEYLQIPENEKGRYFIEIMAEDNAVSASVPVLHKVRSGNYFYNYRVVPQNGVILRTDAGGRYEAAH